MTPSVPSRSEVLEVLNKNMDQEKSVVFATTGYTGRELFNLADQENQFYMVGSMGCVGSLALGNRLSQSEKKVYVLDGDGALAMRLEAMINIGRLSEKGKGYVHILLDNGVHESTGGQESFLIVSISNLLQKVADIKNL